MYNTEKCCCYQIHWLITESSIFPSVNSSVSKSQC
uniref:Uncharacterized protein n=1 Tax=Anguilla anguilla TaxID=7936 RepID=A0A0E9VTK4_ANGAN